MNIGVLASHEGTTLQSLIDARGEGRIAGRRNVGQLAFNVVAGLMRAICSAPSTLDAAATA